MCHRKEGRKCEKWRDERQERLEQFNVNSLDDHNKSISSRVVMLGCRGAWPGESSSGPIICFTAGGLCCVCMKIHWVHCCRLDQSKAKKKRDIARCSRQCKKFQNWNGNNWAINWTGLICGLQICTVYSSSVLYTNAPQTQSYTHRQPDNRMDNNVFFSFSRLAKYVWATSHSSDCYVAHCERRAGQAALLALAGVHAGESPLINVFMQIYS